MDRDKYILENLGLVHALAHKFTGKGVEYDDLYQVGCVGLIKAVDGFDFSRGVKFSTYAVPVILGEIKRIFRDGGTVKVGRRLKELSLKVTRTREKLELQNGREPSVSEIAEHLGVSKESVAEAVCSAQPVMSLTMDSENEDKQIDVPIEFEDEKIVGRIAVERILSNLELEDQKIIQLRYFKLKTQQEIAKELGLTQVQVSRREKRILSILRNRLTG